MSRLNQYATKLRLRDVIAQTESLLIRLWQDYARNPAKLTRLQSMLLAVLVLWSLASASQLFWAPWRSISLEAIPAEMINIPRLTAGSGNIAVDINPVLGSGIFGGDPDTLEDEGGAASIDSGREGIEQNAKETRLALVLTGIVASTEDGLGSAVIKGGSREQVYAVGDDLPVSGKVTLVKVMPRQVVIDNSGTYELIKLYEGPGLVLPTRAAQRARPDLATPVTSQSGGDDTVVDVEVRAIVAGQYRQQLYEAPESLARVVSVSPVREGGSVSGYRVAPGADRDAFNATGFQSGDVVKAVNGLALSDASNTLKLYQLMKDANQATFELERNGESVTLSVDLASP
ncbi:MAG: type II secretion system protein GspC [Halieaceae bacterium]|nr:type II secretion system protein GspC [Halieaceae bacterium]